MPLTDEEQIQRFLAKYRELAEPYYGYGQNVIDTANKLVSKLDSCLYAGVIRAVLHNVYQQVQDGPWNREHSQRCFRLIEALCKNTIHYAEDERESILFFMHELSILGPEKNAFIHPRIFVDLLSSLITYLKKETLIARYRPKLEELYRSLNIWTDSEAYQFRWELDALLFGENTTNLAALVKRYASATDVPLAQQAEELLRAYHEELGDTSFSVEYHPCFQVLCQVTSPLRLACVRALLKREINEAQDKPILKVFLTEEHTYTFDDIHDILHQLMVNIELHGSAFLLYCIARPELLEKFAHLSIERAGFDRGWTEDTIKSILSLLSKIALVDDWNYKKMESVSALIRMRVNLVTYIKNEGLVETYRPELEELSRSASIWCNYEPYHEAYQFRWELDALLFGENTTNLAALVKRYASATDVPLAQQAEELLHAYHEELGNLGWFREHPCFTLLCQVAPPLQIACVRTLLKGNLNEKQDRPLFVQFMTEKQDYTLDDIHDILHQLNAKFVLDGPEVLDYCYFTPERLETFLRIVREQAGFDRCRSALETMYQLVSTWNDYTLSSRENNIRLILYRLLFPSQEGALTTLLHQYREKTASLDDASVQTILTTLHLERAGLDLFDPISLPYKHAFWRVTLQQYMLTSSTLSDQLAKTFVGAARTRLIVLALQEAQQLWQKIAANTTPPPDFAIIEKAYIRQDIQLAVTLGRTASYAPDDVPRIISCLAKLIEPCTTEGLLVLLRSCKPLLVQPEIFAQCETDLKQLSDARPPVDYRSNALDHQYWLVLTDLVSGYQQQFQYPLLPDVWGKTIIAELAAMTDQERQPWLALLNHCARIKGIKPSPSWIQQARALAAQIDQQVFLDKIQDWLGLFRNQEGQIDESSNTILTRRIDESSTTILQGLIWSCAEGHDRTLSAILAHTALDGYHKQFNGGPLSPRVANACVAVLGTLPGMYAISQLERVRYHIKQASYQKHIQTTFEEVARREHMSLLEPGRAGGV